MTGALAQLWSLINGMQMIVHFPAFSVTPDDATLIVLGEIQKIATFDIPGVSMG